MTIIGKQQADTYVAAHGEGRSMGHCRGLSSDHEVGDIHLWTSWRYECPLPRTSSSC